MCGGATERVDDRIMASRFPRPIAHLRPQEQRAVGSGAPTRARSIALATKEGLRALNTCDG